MKQLLTSLLVTVSMTLTTAMGMEDQTSFTDLPPEIHFNVIGYTLNLTEEQVMTLENLGKKPDIKTMNLTDAQWDVLKSINFEGVKDISRLSQTSKGMDTLMGDIMKGLKNLFPAMINHLGSFGVELTDKFPLFTNIDYKPSQEDMDLSSFLSQYWLTLFDLEEKTKWISALENNHQNPSEQFESGMKNFKWLKTKQEEVDQWYENGLRVRHMVGWCYLPHKNLHLIPSQVFQLVDIENLNIYDNRIFFLPKEIQKLQKLKQLYLGNNKITTIFDDQEHNLIANLIKNNPNLKKLSLDHNPLNEESKKVLKDLKEKHPNINIRL